MSDLVQAVTSVNASFNGHRLSLAKGRVCFADDPFVKANPHLFAPLAVSYVGQSAKADMGRGGVEQATAAPGEKRHVAPKVGDEPKSKRRTKADEG